MNLQQEVFLRQSESDWGTYRFLRENRETRVACHELHYLQMATEKLSKAHFWGQADEGSFSHAAFTTLLKGLKNNAKFRGIMGMKERRAQYRSMISGLLPIALSIERLAPDLAGDGPNPEYPWPPNKPTQAPIEHEFTVFRELERGNGAKLLEVISTLFQTFEQWSP